MSSVAVVATVEASNVPPRVRLDVTDSGSPAYFRTTVTRLNPDGSTSPVRTFDGNPLTLATSGAVRVGLLYDYEAPFGQAVTYSTLETPGASSASVTVPESRVWLIHPGVPELSMPITVASIGDRVRRAQRGLFYPMGRGAPIAVTDGARKSPEGSLELKVSTLSDLAALEDLTADSSVLLLNIPVTLPWGISTEYISVGDMSEARLVDYAAEPKRYVTLPYQVVDRPEGGSQSERTYADVLAAYATYSDVKAAYPTYAALLAGP